MHAHHEDEQELGCGKYHNRHENEHWEEQAERLFHIVGSGYGDNVDLWASWLPRIDRHLREPMLGLLQGEKGNRFVGQLRQKMARSAQNVEIDRGLRGEEIGYVKQTYSESIDYDKVRLHFSGLATWGLGEDVTDFGGHYGRTVGNTIHMPISHLDQYTGELTEAGLRLLAHEIGHVWQYQHRGWGYLPDALIAQLWAAGTGDDAYQWRDEAAAGVPFHKWNPEAQAEMASDYNRALHAITDAVNHGYPPAADCFATMNLALPYVGKLQRGEGARPERSAADEIIVTQGTLVFGPLFPTVYDKLKPW